MKAKVQEISDIHEIGQVIAESVVLFFKDDSTKRIIEELKKANINIVEPIVEKKSSKLEKKKFVFTGELQSITRQQASSLVKKMGGDVASSVSKNTDFVIAGEKAGSKYKKALSLGIKILTEKEFEELINEK